MIKVLIISPALDAQKNVSGISSVVKNIIQIKNVSFTHFQVGRSNTEGSGLLWALRQFFLPFKFFTVLVKNKISIVHLNVPLNNLGVVRESVFLFISKLLGKKTVVHLHGGEFLMTAPKHSVIKKLIAYIVNNGDKVIVLSEVEEASLRKLYHITVQIDALPNTVDTNYYNTLSKEESITGPVNFLFMGRITESKGIYDIYDAFCNLKVQDTKQYNLYFCGDGPLKDFVCEKFSALLGNNFKYYGIVDGDKKLDILSHSDVFLLPSIFGEGMPMALLEAMAAGVMPIVTDDASMKIVVSDKYNGLTVPKHNPVALSTSIQYLLNNPEFIVLAAKKARLKIIENYSLGNYQSWLYNMYALLAGS